VCQHRVQHCVSPTWINILCQHRVPPSCVSSCVSIVCHSPLWARTVLRGAPSVGAQPSFLHAHSIWRCCVLNVHVVHTLRLTHMLCARASCAVRICYAARVCRAAICTRCSACTHCAACTRFLACIHCAACEALPPRRGTSGLSEQSSFLPAHIMCFRH
jgi:hypothetical protein